MRNIIILALLLAVTPAKAFDVDGSLTRIAYKYGINPETVKAIAIVESDKTCGAVDGSSHGIMQVQRGAAKEVGINWPFKSCEDEIEAGVKYLKLAINRAGDTCEAYTLYNEGLNSRLHCSKYGRKVMKWKKI
jgi:soluble lytic murein transglycosylase-like protein